MSSQNAAADAVSILAVAIGPAATRLRDDTPLAGVLCWTLSRWVSDLIGQLGWYSVTIEVVRTIVTSIRRGIVRSFTGVSEDGAEMIVRRVASVIGLCRRSVPRSLGCNGSRERHEPGNL